MHRLKDRVKIQTAVQVAGSGGGLEESYETIATVWAEIKDTTGKSPIGSVQAKDGGTASIVIRYADFVEKDHFILQLRSAGKDRRFRVVSLRNVAYEYLEIEGEEVFEE